MIKTTRAKLRKSRTMISRKSKGQGGIAGRPIDRSASQSIPPSAIIIAGLSTTCAGGAALAAQIILLRYSGSYLDASSTTAIESSFQLDHGLRIRNIPLNKLLGFRGYYRRFRGRHRIWRHTLHVGRAVFGMRTAAESFPARICTARHVH